MSCSALADSSGPGLERARVKEAAGRRGQRVPQPEPEPCDLDAAGQGRHVERKQKQERGKRRRERQNGGSYE